jgi:hypothetical protein
MKENVLLVSILLFSIVFSVINMCKPLCLYNPNGSIREFGVGYKNKTILPVWLLSIVLGILCYLASLFLVKSVLS